MGKRTKKFIKPKAPPRSIGDIIIIISISILLFAAIAGIFIVSMELPSCTNPESDEIIKCVSREGLFYFPFILTVCVYVIAIVVIFLNKDDFRFFHRKRPFENKGLVKKVYPLFSKDWKERPRVERSPEQVKSRRKTAIIMIAVLLVTAMLVPFSFFSKEIWYTDDTIAIYNYVGKKTDTYSIKDADGIEITTYRQLEFYEGGGRKAILPIPIGASYHVKVYIYFGNKYFVVGFSDKHRENYKEDLEYMLHLKNMFPESKITLDIRDLSDVKNRIGLNEEEKKLLDQLIDK